MLYFYRPQTKFGARNVLPRICHSVHRWGDAGLPLDRDHPWTETPMDRDLPPILISSGRYRSGQYAPSPTGMHTLTVKVAMRSNAFCLTCIGTHLGEFSLEVIQRLKIGSSEVSVATLEITLHLCSF